jgi:hypothetical protein
VHDYHNVWKASRHIIRSVRSLRFFDPRKSQMMMSGSIRRSSLKASQQSAVSAYLCVFLFIGSLMAYIRRFLNVYPENWGRQEPKAGR